MLTSMFSGELTNSLYSSPYSQEDWANYFSKFLGNGVTEYYPIIAYANSTTIQINPGMAIVNGQWLWQQDQVQITPTINQGYIVLQYINNVGSYRTVASVDYTYQIPLATFTFTTKIVTFTRIKYTSCYNALKHSLYTTLQNATNTPSMYQLLNQTNNILPKELPLNPNNFGIPAGYKFSSVATLLIINGKYYLSITPITEPIANTKNDTRIEISIDDFINLLSSTSLQCGLMLEAGFPPTFPLTGLPIGQKWDVALIGGETGVGGGLWEFPSGAALAYTLPSNKNILPYVSTSTTFLTPSQLLYLNSNRTTCTSYPAGIKSIKGTKSDKYPLVQGLQYTYNPFFLMCQVFYLNL